MAVLGLAIRGLLGLGVTVTAGTHITDVGEDPVATVSHICGQWGWDNNWGNNRHGDYWTDHPYHGLGTL